MHPFEVQNSSWNALDDHDYTLFYDFQPLNFYWTSPSTTAGVSLSSNVSSERGTKREREQKWSCQSESKACREKLRRDRLNERFSELCSFLHPKGPVKIDKSAILCDAIRASSKLQSEVEELKERKRKLEADIRNVTG